MLIMKETSLILLIAFLCPSSCTIAVKSLARLAVKDYGDYSDVSVSDIQVINDSKQTPFGQLFPGKVVYLTVWRGKINETPYHNNPKYSALVQRFSKYPDVAFANLLICDCNDTTSSGLRLAGKTPAVFSPMNTSSAEGTSFIIGKDGTVLGFRGPKPTDDLLVDYVLFESRKGVPAEKSAKRLIRGINSNSRFKKRELREWYAHHFNKEPLNLSFSVSTP